MPTASHVHEAFPPNAVSIQSGYEEMRIVAQNFVVVPGQLMGVHKDSDVGEIVVIVDDPRKIHHDFVSLVLGRMQRRGRIIGDIDGCLLLWHLLQYPIDILMLRLRNYQCRGKVVLWRHWRAWLEHGSRVPVRIVWVLDRVFGRLGAAGTGGWLLISPKVLSQTNMLWYAPPCLTGVNA